MSKNFSFEPVDEGRAYALEHAEDILNDEDRVFCSGRVLRKKGVIEIK